MFLRFEFDAANNILLARLEGRITEDDTLEFYDTIRKYVTATHASTGIWDFLSVTELVVSSAFIHQLARMESPFPGPPCPRFMVINKTYAFGLARMYALLAERRDPQLQVVHTMEEAFAALGIQSPKFEPLQ